MRKSSLHNSETSTDVGGPPMRPTLGCAAGRAHSLGSASAAPPPSVRPPAPFVFGSRLVLSVMLDTRTTSRVGVCRKRNATRDLTDRLE